MAKRAQATAAFFESSHISNTRNQFAVYLLTET